MARKKAESASLVTESVNNGEITDDALMQRYFDLKNWIESEEKRFKTHLAPHENEMKVIEQEFLKRLNDRGADSTKSEHGTAYKSTLLNVSISPEGTTIYGRVGEEQRFEGREALLEAALDNWGVWGSEMLMISAQKDAVKRYMEENNGQPPPGVKTAYFTRVNIRRS